MKKTLAILLVWASLAGQTQATLVYNGEFQLYQPGSTTTTATLAPTGEWVGWSGVIPATSLPVKGGDGLADFSDATQGTEVDLPGWSKVQGNADLLHNGVGGSVGFNAFASWGGDARIETATAVGTVEANRVYTISAQVGGPSSPATGPISGPLAFHLLANGTQLTPTAQVDVPAHDGSTWWTISRTYDIAALAGNIGDALTIVLGVEDANDIGNRVVFDDISLDTTAVIPEPGTVVLLALAGLGITAYRRRRT